ncbi:Hypothetical protein A7982_01566 [Minicystis rosea]|nr:Hypothetical protein A7982_01566 [Minicystis rosea]
MLSRILASISISFLFLGAPACGGSTPPATEAAPARGPGDAYVAYVTAIGNADRLQEVLPFVSSTGGKRLATDLNTLKANVPGGMLKIGSERVEGDKATVTISGTQRDKDGKEQPATGTVQLVREGGRWKVDQESWSCCR